MGCFDYTCECGGKTCEHIGQQLNGATVVIEVPLVDGTNVYLQGEYEEYGYVTIGDYRFYLNEFEEYFEHWDIDNTSDFLATSIWTLCETTYIHDEDGEHEAFVERDCFPGVTADLTLDILAKCRPCIK